MASYEQSLGLAVCRLVCEGALLNAPVVPSLTKSEGRVEEPRRDSGQSSAIGEECGHLSQRQHNYKVT